jgi:hypothetical protein
MPTFSLPRAAPVRHTTFHSPICSIDERGLETGCYRPLHEFFTSSLVLFPRTKSCILARLR